MKGAETLVLPAGLLLAAAGLWASALAASGPAWADFVRLFDESRLVHVTTVDFCTLTALAPFWMANDAAGRRWEGRDSLLPLLCVLPLIGPAAYLCLRPKTDLSS
jgi:hypothetical protein